MKRIFLLMLPLFVFAFYRDSSSTDDFKKDKANYLNIEQYLVANLDKYKLIKQLINDPSKCVEYNAEYEWESMKSCNDLVKNKNSVFYDFIKKYEALMQRWIKLCKEGKDKYGEYYDKKCEQLIKN